MNTSKSLAEIYKLMKKLDGDIQAREFVSIIVENCISSIEDDGLELSAEELEKRITSKVNEYLEVAKKSHVA